jgi:sarcosine oxidase
MKKKNYDYIVLGLGGIGSGAAYWLARRAGGDVLGLEQFQLGHPNGGSHGYSRIIRHHGYTGDYLKMTPYTYSAWETVEEESALKIVTKTGGVELHMGDYPRPELDKQSAAMTEAGIAFERIDGTELMHRYPQFRVPDNTVAVFQSDTGIVDPSKGNAAHQQLASYHGATLLDHCTVKAIHPFDNGVTVETDNSTFECARLIITAGAWTERMLSNVGINLRLTVSREQLTYYATPNLREFSVGNFPIFWGSTELGGIYGFPVYGEVATKVAIDLSGHEVTVDTRTFDPDEECEVFQERWLEKYIPGFLGPKLYTKTCLYALMPDYNYVLDALPEHPQILVAVGSGHAFKFASLLGKILSELAIDGQTEQPIGSFSLQREAITDPSFPILPAIQKIRDRKRRLVDNDQARSYDVATD